MDKGNDGKRADLVTALRSFADGEGVDHPTLTRFMKSLAETLGKAEMAEQAAEIARGMRLAGVETWGDMRVVDRQVLVDNGGMRPLDAIQFLMLVDEAKRGEEQGEPADGESLGSRDSLQHLQVLVEKGAQGAAATTARVQRAACGAWGLCP